MRRLLYLLLATLAAGAPLGAAPRAPEDGSWIQLDTPNFTFVSNASKRRTASFARSLEELRQALEGTTSGFKLLSPLGSRIYVFADEGSFEPFDLDASGKPAGLAGYFTTTPDGNYVAFDASSPEAPFPVIYHEYVHYVMGNTIPEIPLWLNEGLAEFYSTFAVTGGKAQIGLPVERHLRWLEKHPLLPLEDLFRVGADSPDYNEEGRRGTFYAESWALAHLLVIGDEELKARFPGLLAAIRRGDDPAQAFERTLGIDAATAQQRLARYVRESAFGYLQFTPPQPFDEAEIAARPLERKEVLLRLGDLQAHRHAGSAAEAERYLRAALELDPALAEAWTTLAFVRLAQNRPEEATELCEKALALAPDDPRAHALLGRSLVVTFARSYDETSPPSESTPPLLARAREAYRKALATRPDDPEALAGLGRTFLFERQGLEEGLSAMARAQVLLPARVDLLRDLILLTAASGNRAGARRLLDSALRPRGSAEDVRAAEYALVRPELERVSAMLGEGRVKESRVALRALADEVHDPEVIGRVLSALAAIDAAGPAGEIEAYNRAIAAANAGSDDEALGQFEALSASATDPALREAATARAAELRERRRRKEHVARFNAAVDLANGGDYAAAAAALEALLADGLDGELGEDATRMLEELRGRAKRPKARRP